MTSLQCKLYQFYLDHLTGKALLTIHCVAYLVLLGSRLLRRECSWWGLSVSCWIMHVQGLQLTGIFLECWLLVAQGWVARWCQLVLFCFWWSLVGVTLLAVDCAWWEVGIASWQACPSLGPAAEHVCVQCEQLQRPACWSSVEQIVSDVGSFDSLKLTSRPHNVVGL